MKYLKISLAVLLVAIIGDIILTDAATSQILISVTLNKKESYTTKAWEKETFAIQKYEHSTSITVLNNPCEDCEVLVQVWNSDKDWSASTITKMGNTYKVGRTTHSVPGTHKLKIRRFDATLLKTNHIAIWHID